MKACGSGDGKVVAKNFKVLFNAGRSEHQARDPDHPRCWQPLFDEARFAARTCTRASLNNDKANSKGKVRMECAAAIHFMWNRGWEKVMHACLQHPSVRQHQVGEKSWESVCKTWWESFAGICVFAWRSAWFSGANLGRLRSHSITMGAAHNGLQWGKILGRTFGSTTCISLQRSGESCQSCPFLPWRGATGG